jgi:hypothetical protein
LHPAKRFIQFKRFRAFFTDIGASELVRIGNERVKFFKTCSLVTTSHPSALRQSLQPNITSPGAQPADTPTLPHTPSTSGSLKLSSGSDSNPLIIMLSVGSIGTSTYPAGTEQGERVASNACLGFRNSNDRLLATRL